jgi:hypothetical protein
LVRRISFKLACNLSIFFIFRSIGILVYTAQPKLYGGWCGFTMWLVLFNSVVIYNVYILICLNFDLSFVKHLQYQSRWVRVYYVLGLLIPFAFTLVPFIMGFYNYSDVLGKCTLLTNYQVVNAVNWVCYNFWLFLCFIYCTIIALISTSTMKSNVFKLKDRITAEDPTRQTENLVYQLKRIVARM